MPKDTHLHFYQPENSNFSVKNPLSRRTNYNGSTIVTNMLYLSTYTKDTNVGPLFIACGEHSPILTSIDGITWVSPNNMPTHIINSVSYNNDQIIAVGDTHICTNSNAIPSILSSKNTKDWEFIDNLYGIGNYDIYDITNGVPMYGSSLWVIGDQTSETKIKVSRDSSNWIDSYNNPLSVIYSVAYGNGSFVAIGLDSNTEGTTTYPFVSPDGFSWARANNTPFNSGGFTDLLRFKVDFLNNQWFMTGYDTSVGNTIGISSNGYNWYNSVGTDPFYNGVCRGIAYAKDNNRSSLYIAVGSNDTTKSTIAYSYNGSNWTGVSNNPFPGGYGISVVYGNNTWVALGVSGTSNNLVATSSNGFDWVAGSNPFPMETMRSIKYISTHTTPMMNNTTVNFGSTFSFSVIDNKLALNSGDKYLIFRNSVIDYLNNENMWV